MRRFGKAPPGFRLPDGTRVGEIHLQISDLPRSVQFYESVLGFRVVSRVPGAVAIGAQDDKRPLIWLHGGDGFRPTAGGKLGLYHFAVLLPDRAALGRLVKQLARHGARAGTADHLVSEAVYLNDPDGLGIEVYADRPRTAWKTEAGELVMATEPLDRHDLAAAAGDEEWEGLPPGSSIGHIHLHVGDLEQAERFYHSALGFDKVVWSYPGALFFSAGGYHHHVGANTWGTGNAPASGEARLLSWQLLVPGHEHIRGASESLLSQGYEVDGTPQGFASTDPWGTRIELAGAADNA